MEVERLHGARAHVACRADLQRYVALAQIGHQLGIFGSSDAVPDSTGAEVDGRPHRIRTHGFARVRERHPEARLIVIGGGDQEGFLKEVVRAEGIEGGEFHGAGGHAEVADWLK